MNFKDIDLTHKRTRDRVRFCLAGIDADPSQTVSRFDLDRLCGQPNKPLGRVLRRNCFVRKVDVTAMRLGEFIEYRAFKPAVDDLRLRLQQYDATQEI